MTQTDHRIMKILDKDLGDRLLSKVPMEKYPFADPLWMLKNGFFSGRYQMSAQFSATGEVEGLMLYVIIGEICHVVLIWAPNLLLNDFKDLWKRFEESLGDMVKVMRWWTVYPKQFARMTGAKEIFTMMELRR